MFLSLAKHHNYPSVSTVCFCMNKATCMHACTHARPLKELTSLPFPVYSFIHYSPHPPVFACTQHQTHVHAFHTQGFEEVTRILIIHPHFFSFFWSCFWGFSSFFAVKSRHRWSTAIVAVRLKIQPTPDLLTTLQLKWVLMHPDYKTWTGKGHG